MILSLFFDELLNHELSVSNGWKLIIEDLSFLNESSCLIKVVFYLKFEYFW